jgi:hypothetical protein
MFAKKMKTIRIPSKYQGGRSRMKESIYMAWKGVKDYGNGL